ncbi:DUF4411 family protein [Candidatus Bipolaricaulota bacterium]
MPYLLDANVFISAKRDHYRMSVCPGFWDWLSAAHSHGHVYSIKKVSEELKKPGDSLSAWAKGMPGGFFLGPGAGFGAASTAVSRWVQAQSYFPAAVSEFFSVADYWLVAQALETGYMLVTHEVPRPDAKRSVKIPDVCNGVGVDWMNPFDMLELLGAQFNL